MVQAIGNSFSEYSEEIAQSFLQSVVAVDDNMNFEMAVIDQTMGELIEPTDTAGVATALVSEPDSGGSTEEVSHALCYQMLSTSFAKRGVVCSGFKPLTDREESLDAIVKTSKNADITILDWQMDEPGNDGSLATQSIIELATNDKKEGGRLRLIAVYTAENSQEVLRLLIESLGTEFSPTQQGDSITFDDNRLAHWKIEIVSKDNSEDELVSKLISSFSQLTAGLLSNAALSAISDIRDKTHNILHRFNQSLDPAYLSHVLGLLSLPDMREQAHEVAFDYAVDLISEELKSELQTSSKVKESLKKEIIECWPEHIVPGNHRGYFRLKIGADDSVAFNFDEMKKLLTASSDTELSEVLVTDLKIPEKEEISAIDRFKNEAVQLTINNDQPAPLLELCAIESSRRDVNTVASHIPVLKQGVVLKNPGTGKFFVCVQPLCDSVRLKGPSNFPLLRIRKDNSTFSHVLRNKDNHLKLNIKPAPKEIRTYNFIPDGEKRTVRAVKEGDKFIFKGKLEGSDQEITFEWCGEFKQAVSQAIINGLAAQLSRVGIDTFEWLRVRNSNL
jgi:hypothetical protein